LFSDQEVVQLLPQDNTIALRAEGIELSSRLVDGNYPDYQQIIPTDWKTKIIVKREELIRALRTLLVFLPRDSRRVKLKIKPKQESMHLQVEGGEIGEGDVQVSVTGEGEDLELLLNVQYVLEGLQHIGGEECEISLGGQEAPAVFRPKDKSEDYVYVVMPIQT